MKHGGLESSSLPSGITQITFGAGATSSDTFVGGGPTGIEGVAGLVNVNDQRCVI